MSTRLNTVMHKQLIDYAPSNRYTTPQGYWVFPRSVLARTGIQEYDGAEIGQTPGQIYQVERTAEEVFSPESIRSFEGMPVTLYHPDALEVTAKTWQQLAKGFVKNVQRDGCYLVGDVWLHDFATIEAITHQQIKEISLGYSSEIIEVNGRFRQSHIVGNHVAIVPHGRCGGECQLGDHQGGEQVKKTLKTRVDAIARILGLQHPTTAQRQRLVDTAIELGLDAEQPLDDNEETQVDEHVQDNTAPAGSTPHQPEGLANPSPLTDNNADQQTVNDALTALQTENMALKKQVDQLHQSRIDAEERYQLVNDAKSLFTHLKIGDSDCARTIRRNAVVQAGLYTEAHANQLADCDLKAAYQHARAMVIQDHRQRFGSGLIQDATMTVRTVDYNRSRGKSA